MANNWVISIQSLWKFEAHENSDKASIISIIAKELGLSNLVIILITPFVIRSMEPVWLSDNNVQCI